MRNEADDFFKVLGHDAKYYMELEKQAVSLNLTHLIEEIANLRAKNSFYEQRIQEMNVLATKVNVFNLK